MGRIFQVRGGWGAKEPRYPPECSRAPGCQLTLFQDSVFIGWRDWTGGQGSTMIAREVESGEAFSTDREFFIDNLLVRIHFIMVMIRWTGLAP